MSTIEIIRISRPHLTKSVLHRFLEQRSTSETTPPQQRLYFTVKYKDETGQVLETTIRGIDAARMENPFSPEAQQHFELILKAREGNEAAQANLKQRLAEDRLNFERFSPSRIDLGRHGAVLIPSTMSGSPDPLLVSNKGLNLLRLIGEGFPVPAFCLITTRIKEGLFQQRINAVDQAVKVLEQLTGRVFNDPDNPLLFSMRSCLLTYLPGLMPTWLNLGATERALPGLIRRYGHEGALDLRINHDLLMFLDYNPALAPQLQTILTPYPITIEAKENALFGINALMKDESGAFRWPHKHIWHFYSRVLEFYESNKAKLHAFADRDDIFPVAILQEMEVGRLSWPGSFSAVFHTRTPQTGIGSQFSVAERTFGEEIMTGPARPAAIFPETRPLLREDYPEFETLRPALVSCEKDEGPLLFELTAQGGEIAVLQMNRPSLAGPAALKVAADMFRTGIIGRKGLIELVEPYHLRQLLADKVIVPEVWTPVATGTRILPRGDVCGQIYFSEEKALAAKSSGEKVVLCKEDFFPKDVDVMIEVNGLVSIAGAPIHVAEIAFRYGITALAGLSEGGRSPEIKGDKLVFASGKEIQEGEFIVLSSESESLYVGQAETQQTPFALAFMGTIEPEELSPDDRSLWESFQLLSAELGKVELCDIEDARALSNLNNMLTFIGKAEKAKQLVNAWFDAHPNELVQFFLNTRIGKHKGRLEVFKRLSLDNQEKLIRGILAATSSSSGKGTYIIGRLLICLEEEIGSPAYRRFVRKFTPEEEDVLAEEREKAEHYLTISRNTISPPSPTTASVGRPEQSKPLQKSPRDLFMIALVQRLGQAKVNGLSPEQITKMRQMWELDPDPEHKPARTIEGILTRTQTT